MNSTFISRLIRNRLLQHGLFWVLSFAFLLHFFAYSSELSKTDWIYAGLFHLPLILAVYANLRGLIPILLNRKKYLLYVAALFILTLFTAWFLQLTFEVLADYIFPGYYFISYYEPVDYLKFGLTYLALTTLLKLSKSWFDLYETKQLLEKLKSEQLQTELMALKGQINPHFLFNSLNSIYSLSIENEPVAPKFILKLADVLRYMIYEANVEKVPLKKEMEYLENYVELQRLRVDEKVTILFEIAGKIKNQQIAPLLLIPLVENGFKHGVKGDTENTFIKMFIKIENLQFHFIVENNKGLVDEIEPKVYGGIGLQNVRRRLDLLYPGKHELNIDDLENTFKVDLKLELSE